MAKKQSSERLTELASAILREGYEPTTEEIRSLAASVLSQREAPMTEGKNSWTPKKPWWKF